MAWYWITLIGIGAFIGGFTAALFWLRDVIRRNRRKNTPYTYTQMNPYA